jgi:hypothetical protein
VKLFSGNAPVSSPLDMTDLWLFDASYLLFKDQDPSSTLRRVDILVSSDKLRSSVRASIDPSRSDAMILPVLIDREARQVKASISFVTEDRGTVRWQYSGKNLKEIPDYQGGMVFLSDWDWME